MAIDLNSLSKYPDTFYLYNSPIRITSSDSLVSISNYSSIKRLIEVNGVISTSRKSPVHAVYKSYNPLVGKPSDSSKNYTLKSA